MGVTAAVIATVAGVGGAAASNKAAKEQNKANEKARGAEQRTNALENARRTRQAIAERRIREAETVQLGFNTGISQSSNIEGARGALVSDTAGNIGAFNTRIAGSQVQSEKILRGAQDFAKYQGYANTLGAVSSAAGALGGSGAADALGNKLKSFKMPGSSGKMV